MTEMFFYQERGKTVGPFSPEDIKTRIRDGRIRVFDLLYKDGEDGWKMALEHGAFRSEFKASTLASLKDRPWVCLQKKSKSSVDFITTGPFTQDEIREALQNGKISYSDYAWKDSLAEWKRIGSLEEFNPRARQVNLPPVPSVPEASSTDLLKNVVEFQRPLPVNAEAEVPPEADREFLPPPVPGGAPAQVPKNRGADAKSQPTGKIKAASPPAVTPDTVTRSWNFTPGTMTDIKVTEVKPASTQEISPPASSAPPAVKSTTKPEPKSPAAAAVAKTSAPDAAATGSIRMRAARRPEGTDVHESRVTQRKPRPWMDWSIVGFLALILVAVVLLVSRFVLPKAQVQIPEASQQAAATEPLSQPVTAPPPPPPLQPETTAAQSEPAPAPEIKKTPEPPPPPHAPEELSLAVHAGGNSVPQIDVRTDGTREYPVYLQIIGLPGQVGDGGAYYRFFKLTPSGKMKTPVELPAIKLPQGKFIVRAETTGELRKETKFSWGLNDAAYKTGVARQRKVWAHALWKERLNLFILAQALEKQVASALVPSKKFQARKWESLIALKRGEGNKYLMFDDWWELHNIAKEAKAGVTGALVTRAQKERERLASFSVWK